MGEGEFDPSGKADAHGDIEAKKPNLNVPIRTVILQEILLSLPLVPS